MVPLFCHTNWRAPGRGGANFPKSARLPNTYAVFIKLSYAFCVFFPRVGRGTSWPRRLWKTHDPSSAGVSDVLQQHRARAGAKKVQCAGEADVRACRNNLWRLYSAIQAGGHQGVAEHILSQGACLQKAGNKAGQPGRPQGRQQGRQATRQATRQT